MKKIFFGLFIFCSTLCFSQTWVECSSDTAYEITIISKEQFDRLLKQNEERYNYAALSYYDVLEQVSYRVISGTRPKLSGYYYYAIRRIPSPDRTDLILSTIVYGNSNTGQMVLEFGNSLFMIDYYGATYLRSDFGWSRYVNKYNQFIGYVNGR